MDRTRIKNNSQEGFLVLTIYPLSHSKGSHPLLDEGLLWYRDVFALRVALGEYAHNIPHLVYKSNLCSFLTFKHTCIIKFFLSLAF